MTLATSGIGFNSYDAPADMATGSFTGDGSGAVGVAIGFTPRLVVLVDLSNAKRYEWILGMAATYSMIDTNGAYATDTNSAVVTNESLVSVTTAGTYPPGQSPDDGSLGGTTVIVQKIDHSKANLTFGINVTSALYTWYAIG